MAIVNPPLGLQNAGATHTASILRTALAGVLAGNYSTATTLRARGGVHPSLGQELVVTQTGSPSMAVLVEPGAVYIPGTESSTQGNYFAWNDAQVTLSITAAHATLPRIDIVVINVRDAFYSGASNDSQLQVIAGTPASSPVAPSAPNNSITLAQVAVGAAVTSIVNANITDTRFYVAAVGGVIRARSDATRPTSAEIPESQLVWSDDVNKLYVWDGTTYKQLYPSYDKLAENILGSAAASVTFSAISSNYRTLLLEVTARSDVAAAFTNLRLRFNSDAAANYDGQELFGNVSTAAGAEYIATTSMDVGQVAAASATSGASGIASIEIPWYAGTTFWKALTSKNALSTGTGTGTLYSKLWVGRWRSAVAITSITLLPQAGNFITGSSFALYGLP